ncbi:MAG: hypothetical protein EXS31_04360 [Pedosphaera sp.]|nr:hypothetical protein [Pedosphaera sp.]
MGRSVHAVIGFMAFYSAPEFRMRNTPDIKLLTTADHGLRPIRVPKAIRDEKWVPASAGGDFRTKTVLPRRRMEVFRQKFTSRVGGKWPPHE